MSFPAILKPDKHQPEAKNSPASAEGLLSPALLRQINRLKLNANRFLPGYAIGQRPSQRRRPAAEFKEQRMYIPGDDVRFVDWRASARAEHIFIKQGEQPKEATIYILLDCSASMGWGKPPKSAALLRIAAALAYLALNAGDRVAVVPLLDKTSQPLGPVSGKGQLPALTNYMRNLSFSGHTALEESVHTFSRQLRRGSGMVWLISDLLGAGDLDTALNYLPAPTWDVVVLQLLHPEEIHPTLRGDFELRDCESGETANYDLTDSAIQVYLQRMEEWKNQLDALCVRHHAFYTLVSTGWSMEREVLAHFREHDLVKPL